MLAKGSSLARRAPILVGWALGVGCFVYLMALPPTLFSADESFVLYGAKRVLQGEALYRDFWEFLTPGTYYLYAASYAVGGVSITSARVTTALVNALSATGTYFLTLHVASMAEAVVAGLLVPVICIPVWNQASHHWIATGLGIATAAVLLSSRWADSTRGRPAAAGALAGLLVCTHQARGLSLILWLAIATPALTLVRGACDRWRRCLRELLWTAVGGAAVCLPILGYAVWRSSLAEMLYATCTWVLTNYRNANVGKVRWSGAPWSKENVRYTYLGLFQAIPAILGVEATSLLWAVWRHGLRSQVVRGVLLLLAVSGMTAILYYPDVIHVAFVAPFAFVVIAGMIYRTRTALAFMKTQATAGLLRLGWVGIVMIVLFKGWENASAAWDATPTLFETGFGILAGRDMDPEFVRDLREHLGVRGGAPPRLFAYHDAWLYLVLPADNPTPFSLLRPGYNTPEQVQEAIDRLERDPHARVVVNLLAFQPNDPFIQYLKEHFPLMTGAGHVRDQVPRFIVFERDSNG